MGAIPLGDFVAPELAVNFASILLQKKPRSRLIAVTIKQRSVHDREVITPRSWPFLLPSSVGIVRRDPGIESTMKDPRSQLDHATIMEFFRESFPPSDGASGEWTIAIHLIQYATIMRRVHRQSSDR